MDSEVERQHRSLNRRGYGNIVAGGSACGSSMGGRSSDDGEKAATIASEASVEATLTMDTMDGAVVVVVEGDNLGRMEEGDLAERQLKSSGSPDASHKMESAGRPVAEDHGDDDINADLSEFLDLPTEYDCPDDESLADLAEASSLASASLAAGSRSQFKKSDKVDGGDDAGSLDGRASGDDAGAQAGRTVGDDDGSVAGRADGDDAGLLDGRADGDYV